MIKTGQTVKTGGGKGFLQVVKKQRARLAGSIAFAVLGQGAGLVPFFMIASVITLLAARPLGAIPSGELYLPLIYGAVGLVLKHVCMAVSSGLSHVAAYDVLYDLRLAISQKLLRLPLGYFNERTSGQLKKVMSEDVEQMEIFLAHNLPDCLGAVMYMLLAAVALFAVDWRMALATIAFVPLGFVFIMVTMGRGKEKTAQWFTLAEKLSHAIIEYIQGMQVIKAFGHTTTSFLKFSETLEQGNLLENETSRCWYLPMAVFAVFLTLNMLCIVPLGAVLLGQNEISLGTYVFFILMGIGFGSPMWVLVQFGRGMVSNRESQVRIDAILEAPDLRETGERRAAGWDVAAQGVVFSYGNNGGKALDGMDCAIPEHSFVALVGPSGAGKTTLARLLPRFWDVSGGSIRLGDTDIRDIKLDDLMAQYGFIFQNVYLYNDTVLANLRIGNPRATDEEIKSAARAACCHEFIMELPQGYDSVIGERGSRISGGERQRLSIARALLKNAPILILDEATAFIDPENEVLLQQSINRLVANKTLVAIAHRLSSIVAADQILVLDQGRVVAQGTHKELLAESHLYKSMWDAHMAAQAWTLEGDAC
ncbi:ABC transporter ATP-binding protein [Solidesulfovibrio sp. C21]|uniref:ABC transporter ATP-binding protein n=1 Tax=Solidesulfovibrio sp. C21 TaxID=3398613 RepID=UPI0039FC6BFD